MLGVDPRKGAAHDLGCAFLEVPGTAIVAVEEAKAIAAERDLTPDKSGERLVSSFIEGEYRTVRNIQSNRHQVEITLRAYNGTGMILENKLPATAISQSFRVLMDCLKQDAFDLSTPTTTKLDEQAQFGFLLERADSFSKLGDQPMESPPLCPLRSSCLQ